MSENTEIFLKLLFIGNDNANKAYLLTSFVENKIPDYALSFSNTTVDCKVNNNETDLVISLWDTSGQEEYEKIRKMSYPDTDYFILVFTMDDKKSFLDLQKKYIPEIKEYCPFAKFFLISTFTKENTKITKEEIEELKKEINAINFFEINLKNLENIKNSFQEIAEQCYRYKFLNNGFEFVTNLELDIVKIEYLIKYKEIIDYNDLMRICGASGKKSRKYTKFKVFFKIYRDLNFVYEIIIKFITIYFIKTHLNNLQFIENNYNNGDDGILIYCNKLLSILKDFQIKYENIKFEINSNYLSKFIIDNILNIEELSKNLPFKIDVKKLDFLSENNSFQKLQNFITFKNKYQIEFIDKFVKPYIIDNRYVLIELLGEGGFGIVFKAFDLDKYRFVAIKFITTFESLNGFEREIKVITNLESHNNIINYFDYGYFSYNKNNTTIPFIVMEMCNYSLYDRLFYINKEFPLKERLELFKQMCEGVEHLHLNNIMHRDLKLDNALILLTEISNNNQLNNNNSNYNLKNNLKNNLNKIVNNNNNIDSNNNNNNTIEIIKIVDFGTAKQQQKRKGTMTINIGTWNYMAPELFYENKELFETIKKEEQLSNIDFAIDIYSLGCTLFLLLTKRKLEYNNNYCKFYEMLKDEKSEKRLHNYLSNVISIILQNEDKCVTEILQRLTISMIQRNPLKRPKITIIIDILNVVLSFLSLSQQQLQNNNIQLTNSLSEALLPLTDFNQEIINEKDKLIKILEMKLIEKEKIIKENCNEIVKKDQIIMEYKQWIDELLNEKVKDYF